MAQTKKRSHALRPDEISRLRALRGLTVEELAENAGIHPRTLTRKLAGEGAYLSTAKRLADALGVECANILADPSSASQVPKVLKEAEVLPGPVVFQNDFQTLQLTVNLGDQVIAPDQHRRVRLLVDFLASLLPDNNGISASASGAAGVTTVPMSVDNLMALGTKTARMGLSDLGVDQATLAYGEPRNAGDGQAAPIRPPNAAGVERSEYWRPLLPSEVKTLSEWGWAAVVDAANSDDEEYRQRAARAAARTADFDDLAALMPAGLSGRYRYGDKDFYHFHVDNQSEIAASYIGHLIASLRG